MSSETPKRFLIGGAMVAGAVVLAWLSSPATMDLERTRAEPAPIEQAQVEGTPAERRQGGTATISTSSRLFGLFEFGRQRIDGVRGARMVDSRVPGTNSTTPPHLVFETTGGDVNLGWVQQLFARDFVELRGFFENQAEARLTVSSIARSSESRRFIFAQIIVLFLGLLGITIVWSGIRSLWS
jgi:hypothetical protein